MSLFRKKSKNIKAKTLEEHVQKLKENGKETVYITAFKRNQSWSVANPFNYGYINAMIGLSTDKVCTENAYRIKVCEFDISYPLWVDEVYQKLEDKADELKSFLEKNGLEAILSRGFEWIKEKQEAK